MSMRKTHSPRVTVVKVLMYIRMIMSVDKLTELFTKLVAIPAQCLMQSLDKEVLP